ncbi:unnamed protein product [Cunninghamella blakesleeana]
MAATATTKDDTTMNTVLEETKAITSSQKSVLPELYTLNFIYHHLSNNIKQLKDTDHLKQQLNQLNTSLKEYISKEQAGRDLWGDVQWRTKRIRILSHYRYQWEKSFQIIKELSQQSSYDTWNITTARDQFTTIQKQESDLAFHFWDSFTSSPSLVVSWDDFQNKYQRRFGSWDEDTKETLYHLITNNAAFKNSPSEQVTVFDFMAIINDYGFPLNIEQLPTLSLPRLSESTKIETAKLLTDLMVDFSSQETREHLIALYTYFKDVNRKDKQAMQEKANQWASVIISSRGIDKQKFTPQQLEADAVDMARRSISFFYQRYMVLWRTGQYARDLFSEVDFPGKARIFEVGEYVLPLDHANYHVVIKGDATKWETKRPKVYKFLDQLVKL